MSPDKSHDLSPTSDLHVPAKNTGEKGDLAAQFLAALDEHAGSVPLALTAMEQDGKVCPSRGYAYKLRGIWKSRQPPAPVSGRLTRVK
ncbi:MAG: hypothetical protein JWN00_3371 [Actinomycetia bacterium]|nr:hypothetical protein [Actinomycetes bacterium]